MPAPPSPAASLSIAVACRNNAPTIGRLLESIRPLAPEIVAVDSGSTDGTDAQIAAAGGNVLRSPWLGYVRTKQIAIDACTRPWVMLLDSDESLTPDLAAAIAAALPAAPPDVSAFEINRRVYYKGRPLRHAWQPEWRLRLFRNGHARQAGTDPHDYLQPLKGRTARLSGDLRHDSFDSFSQQLAKQVRYAEVMSDAMIAAGRRGSRLRLLLSPPGAFLKQLLLRRAFLDGLPGWLAAACSAQQALNKHAMLLEKSRTPPI